ncbi:MAG: hypothetical protein ABSA52_00960 [Candidatus Binatia bacterium]|jgi:hypothetical protein
MRAATTMSAIEVVKLRMKIGVHEFEAEGPRDLVTAQLETWKHLAGLYAAAATADGRTAAGDPALRPPFAADAERKLIRLRVSPSGQRRNADAALLILYGYHTWFAATDEEEVPATRLKAALAASGHRPKRLDRVLAPHLAAGLVSKSGRHRHETYALTISGAPARRGARTPAL